VKLVAVSKGQPIEAVLLAFAAGQTAFGENYAQQLHEKPTRSRRPSGTSSARCRRTR